MRVKLYWSFEKQIWTAGTCFTDHVSKPFGKVQRSSLLRWSQCQEEKDGVARLSIAPPARAGRKSSTLCTISSLEYAYKIHIYGGHPFGLQSKGYLLLDLNISCLPPRLSLQGLRQQLLSKLQTKLEVNNNFFRQSSYFDNFDNFWATGAGAAWGGELPLPWVEPLHWEVGIWEYVLLDDELSGYLRIFENMYWWTISCQNIWEYLKICRGGR